MAVGLELDADTYFADLSPDVSPIEPNSWPALIVKRALIEEKIGRLLDADQRPNSRRAANIVHPASGNILPAVTPGLAITIQVVRPGEQLELLRDNATRIEFCLGGEGTATIGRRKLPMAKWNVLSLPSMTRRLYRNEGKEPLVWFSYSNMPLLERLGVYYSDELDTVPRAPLSERSATEQRYIARNAPDIAVADDGARLRGYEFCVDIDVVENKPLVWPWSEVTQHLKSEVEDDKRGLMLLYNPATGRRQGTTPSFFAALSRTPAGTLRPVAPRGHKHSSFACNYHFAGSGESIVDGQHYEWEAGDLMLSAPSWSEHAHGVRGASILTVQDHPFQIAIESLIWQENMDGPILTLGAEPGQTGYVGPRVRGD